ncbi:M16 family metallopeptidase [Deinococcus fonticola]|uniref:M16 family metallopeptidase n=1 Tax=Deinococcus fonticola TaxID=2528713 RepID=UPI001074AFC7|nr:pitrilysin family protein [Deinococcus fonticola]
MKHVLPSGLTLLLESDPHAQSVAAGYFVNTGARDERPSEMGCSHFLEHLMFKGSEELDAVTLNERLDDLGGHSNAFTSEEATVYHAAALPERLDELLDTLTHLMRPALRDADLQAERGVILEEIAMYAEQPGVCVVDELRGDYYGPHPLGHRVLGTVETVSALTQGQLARNHRERYGAQHVTLVLVGAFDEQAALDWASRELASWPAGRPTPPVPAPQPPAQSSFRHLHDPSLHRVQVALTTPGLGVRHPLREAAALLADLLGGDGGALYWALVDTGLADMADLAHLDYRDSGVFEGGFSCDPGRLDAVLSAYLNVLSGAQALITEAAVRRAARKAAVATLLRAETPQGRLFTLGMEYLAVGEVRSNAELAARFTRVTAADVREVLRLCPLHPVTGVILGP